MMPTGTARIRGVRPGRPTTRSIALLAVAIGAALLSPAPALTANLTASQLRQIDQVFADIAPDAPGCASAIVRDGRIAYSKAFGMQDVEQKTRLTADSAFDLASTSKQFTAFTIVQLADAGRLSLDDDIRKWLPEFRDYGTPIRIRHLLNHTSGMRDYSYLFFLKGYSEKDYFTDREAIELLARQSALNFAPGSAYAYSNSGYILLAEIVKRVTGATLADYADRTIFVPLGMRASHFQDNIQRLSPNRAHGYSIDTAGRVSLDESSLEIVGDGSLISSLNDFLKWDRDFYAGRIWTPSIKREMLRPGVLADGRPSGDGDEAYASGLEIGERGGLTFITHGGSSAGFRSDFLRFPEPGVTIAAFCNFARSRPFDRVTQMADIILAGTYRQSPEKIAPKSAAAKARPTDLVPDELARDMAGRYFNKDLDSTYTVSFDKGRPIVTSDRRNAPFDFPSFGALPGYMGGNTIGNENMRLIFGRGPDKSSINRFVVNTSRVFGLVFDKQQ